MNKPKTYEVSSETVNLVIEGLERTIHLLINERNIIQNKITDANKELTDLKKKLNLI